MLGACEWLAAGIDSARFLKFFLDLDHATPARRRILSISLSITRKGTKRVPWLTRKQVLFCQAAPVKRWEEAGLKLQWTTVTRTIQNKKIATRMLAWSFAIF
jgi:hypothetical protein